MICFPQSVLHLVVRHSLNLCSHCAYISLSSAVDVSSLHFRIVRVISKIGFVSSHFLNVTHQSISFFLPHLFITINTKSLPPISFHCQYFNSVLSNVDLDCEADTVDWSSVPFSLSSIRSLRVGSIADLDCLDPSNSVFCPNLSHVRLKSSFGSEGVFHLTPALALHPSITSIDLSYNAIENDGIFKLIDFLSSNYTIVSSESEQ
ncbi:hypothetical protein GEMRC1_006918 [Eukaryota sp. GEM-RC1]